jgi:hypothetical protein
MPIKDQPKDGRTSGYDVGIAEIAETICERLVNGESLKAMCRSRDDFERRCWPGLRRRKILTSPL